MRVVVADTTPLNYLLLIDQIDLLRKLFETVNIPDIVRDELAGRGGVPAGTELDCSPAALAHH